MTAKLIRTRQSVVHIEAIEFDIFQMQRPVNEDSVKNKMKIFNDKN